MAEKKQQQTDKEAVLDAERVNDDAQKSKKASLVWLAIILLVVVNAGAYFLWYQQSSTIAQLQQQLSQTQPVVDNSVDIKQLVQAENKAAQNKLSELAAQQQTLTESLAALQQAEEAGDKGREAEKQWLEAELHYLLTVANRRLLLAKDVEGAKSALTMASQRIESVGDYSLHPLRALLADEQQALAAVNKVDVEALALQLQTALNRVDELQMWMGPEVTAEQESNDEEVVSDQSWQQVLTSMWTEVKSLVVIRHKQDGNAAVLVPEQRYFVYQNLRLQLESARYALLSGEVNTYKSSLKAATDWLDRYFVGDERDAMSTTLHELQQHDIEQDFPDISASLSWLKAQGTEQ
ncbi:hypothetical protein A9Q78_06915 [Methylophaga sp. 41_12_T18]|nr:hypothetical protein A9Q78_06915 [Methylophaga sp. 41_12_T18]